MPNLGFERTLVVATHGIVQSTEYGLSPKGVDQTNKLVREVGKLLPDNSNVLILSEKEDGYLRETAHCFAAFYSTVVAGLASLNLENSGTYDLSREDALFADLTQHKINQYDGLVIVTTSQMSDWLPGHIHKNGRGQLKLRESRAYIVKPDGETYVADSASTQWWSGSRA
jgi:hypothetical protein